MTSPRVLTRLALVSALVAGGIRPLAGQGIGGSVGLGAYRSTSRFESKLGIGLDLAGRWASRSGIGVGLGARYIRYDSGDRASAFIDVRYAPFPSLTHRIQPIIGMRAGPFVGGGDFDDDTLFGLQAGPVLGLAVGVATGVSLTIAGDLVMIVDTNLYYGARRFVPGLQVGMTFH